MIFLEVKKCFQVQLHEKELELNEIMEQMKDIPYKYVGRKLSDLIANLESETNSSMNSENTTTLDDKEFKNCVKLQRDVAKLENEVKDVLDSLRCNTSVNII